LLSQPSSKPANTISPLATIHMSQRTGRKASRPTSHKFSFGLEATKRALPSIYSLKPEKKRGE
jgi:hypothetical protein